MNQQLYSVIEMAERAELDAEVLCAVYCLVVEVAAGIMRAN
jgi:hypothetical protein